MQKKDIGLAVCFGMVIWLGYRGDWPIIVGMGFFAVFVIATRIEELLVRLIEATEKNPDRD